MTTNKANKVSKTTTAKTAAKPAVKPVAKPAVKTTAAPAKEEPKKEAVKPVAEEEKPVAKTTAAKTARKTTRKPRKTSKATIRKTAATVDSEVFVQIYGQEFSQQEIMEKVVAAWEAEEAGEEPQIGFDAGTARDFCTEEDYELYDWAHNRVQYDWAKPFDNAKITSIWNLAAEIIAEGVDARSAADAAYKSAVEKATEMGLISAKE